MTLYNLNNALWDSYLQTGKQEEPDEAIEYGRASLALRPVGHLDRPMSLTSLGNALWTSYQ